MLYNRTRLQEPLGYLCPENYEILSLSAKLRVQRILQGSNGEITSEVDRLTFAASSAYSLAVNNSDIVIVSKTAAVYDFTTKTILKLTVKSKFQVMPYPL